MFLFIFSMEALGNMDPMIKKTPKINLRVMPPSYCHYSVIVLLIDGFR